MRAARESCPNDEVMCQCMPIFQAKGPKIWAWRTLHVEKPADESISRLLDTRDKNSWRDMLEADIDDNYIRYISKGVG